MDDFHYIVSRYTANLTTLESYISLIIIDMEWITKRKIIQKKILNRIGVLNFFSVCFENPYFATMGKPLKCGQMSNYRDETFLGVTGLFVQIHPNWPPKAKLDYYRLGFFPFLFFGQIVPGRIVLPPTIIYN